MAKEPKDLLLLVWVHGFKGNDVTFESFPERICHLLRSTHPSLRVESRVFPMYQTRGELLAATLAFVDWLTELVVNLENDHGKGGGAGKAKVVLMGHSMGGLLCADTVRDIAASTREGDPIWPRVVGIIAFDTPYLGLHPHTFKHHLTQAASYFDQARSVASTIGIISPAALGLGFGKFGKRTSETGSSGSGPSASMKSKEKGTSTTVSDIHDSGDQETAASKSFWRSLSSVPSPSSKTLYGLGAAALGAAALGTVYYRREDFITGWRWGYDHMTFVKNLWDEDGLRRRLEAIDELIREQNILYSNYYTHLPAEPPVHLVSRTFAILPPTPHLLFPRWRPATNTIAKDEVSAHMGMFNPKTNDGFYDLGLAVVKEIGERIESEGVGRKEGVEERMDENGEGVWRIEKDKDGKEIWVEA
ncbi:Hypothetical Protein CGB_B1020W [Cryptococcus gattii WM276]|uniref:DUF676 domain-containing protein n=1 Tax=Cryptococcus gattii serotype B (strain WM276 / ATCC MYA-4071) TaxID=367775 RepID=E6QZX2_CRYGW|nr:Hypothetical Protein CGB_B1020W [Cryptococcus gattii WM276]ADV20132.1 Hypothetical Protein CGB_B1020W [Cryptococcus gattii WM276]